MSASFIRRLLIPRLSKSCRKSLLKTTPIFFAEPLEARRRQAD